ncbi:hypothetical protein [Hymenobacter sp.]|uniref:hypothetical protein n=1 Tax=Hymenobacter sp. TaxID=1898978 RepID=UPI00286AA677|nr:hypothetical protein [Hymenobacter sp.]
MRSLTLLLAGLPADLPAQTRGLVRLTQARAPLGDLGARVGEYSWPLTLPPTRGNARIFGVDALHPAGLDKFRALDYPFELLVGGQRLAGTFRLSALRGGYTGALLGAGTAWGQLLGEKTLPELGFAPVAYDGSQLEAIQALDGDQTDLQFPLIAYGNFYAPPRLTTGPDGTSELVSLPPQARLLFPLAVDDCPPCVYYRNVLRQIFADLGWTLTGRVLDEPAWRAALLAPAGADLDAAWPWGGLLPAAAAATIPQQQDSFFEYGPGSDNFSSTAVGVDEPGRVRYFGLATDQVTAGGGTRALAPGQAAYTAPRAGAYSFAWSATVAAASQFIDEQNNPGGARYAPHFAPVVLGLVVFRGGEGYEGADGGVSTGGTGAFAPGQQRVTGFVRLDQPGSFALRTGAFAGAAPRLYLEAGDAVRLLAFTCVQYERAGDGLNKYTRKELHLTLAAAAFACTAYEDEQGTSETRLRPAAFLPPLRQRDVLRDFLLRVDAVLLADAGRRTVAVLTRGELSAAAGPPLALGAVLDAAGAEFVPAAGAGVSALRFAAAEHPAEPLPVAGGPDAVRLAVGPPGGSETALPLLYAPVAFRRVAIAQPGGGEAAAELPTLATAAALAQPLAEVEWDVAGQPPRLLRYLGPEADGPTVPFQQRHVPLARAAWDGPLRAAGPEGSVAAYYGETARRLRRGHVAKLPGVLTPAQYAQLTPGRRVDLHGVAYTVEGIGQFDPADEAAAATVELLREC